MKEKMNLTFRRMTDADVASCANGLIKAFKEAPWNENWTYEEASMRIDELMASRMSRGYVIMAGDVAVGMCIGRIMTYTGFRELWVDEFSINPSYQNQNLGSKLLDFVKEELEKENVGKMCLTTIKGYPAVKFYEKNGFKLSETVVFMHN